MYHVATREREIIGGKVKCLFLSQILQCSVLQNPLGQGGEPLPCVPQVVR